MIPLTAAEVEKVLKKNGFVHTRTVGSHFQWISVERHVNVTELALCKVLVSYRMALRKSRIEQPKRFRKRAQRLGGEA